MSSSTTVSLIRPESFRYPDDISWLLNQIRATSSKLATFCVSGVPQLGTDGIRDIVRVLVTSKCRSLEKVEISQCNLGMNAAKILTDLLDHEQFPNLSELVLVDNAIPNLGAFYLQRAVKSRPKDPVIVDLRNNPVEETLKSSLLVDTVGDQTPTKSFSPQKKVASPSKPAKTAVEETQSMSAIEDTPELVAPVQSRSSGSFLTERERTLKSVKVQLARNLHHREALARRVGDVEMKGFVESFLVDEILPHVFAEIDARTALYEEVLPHVETEVQLRSSSRNAMSQGGHSMSDLRHTVRRQLSERERLMQLHTADGVQNADEDEDASSTSPRKAPHELQEEEEERHRRMNTTLGELERRGLLSSTVRATFDRLHGASVQVRSRLPEEKEYQHEAVPEDDVSAAPAFDKEERLAFLQRNRDRLHRIQERIAQRLPPATQAPQPSPSSPQASSPSTTASPAKTDTSPQRSPAAPQRSSPQRSQIAAPNPKSHATGVNASTQRAVVEQKRRDAHEERRKQLEEEQKRRDREREQEREREEERERQRAREAQERQRRQTADTHSTPAKSKPSTAETANPFQKSAIGSAGKPTVVPIPRLPLQTHTASSDASIASRPMPSNVDVASPRSHASEGESVTASPRRREGDRSEEERERDGALRESKAISIRSEGALSIEENDAVLYSEEISTSDSANDDAAAAGDGERERVRASSHETDSPVSPPFVDRYSKGRAPFMDSNEHRGLDSSGEREREDYDDDDDDDDDDIPEDNEEGSSEEDLAADRDESTGGGDHTLQSRDRTIHGSRQHLHIPHEERVPHRHPERVSSAPPSVMARREREVQRHKEGDGRQMRDPETHGTRRSTERENSVHRTATAPTSTPLQLRSGQASAPAKPTPPSLKVQTPTNPPRHAATSPRTPSISSTVRVSASSVSRSISPMRSERPPISTPDSQGSPRARTGSPEWSARRVSWSSAENGRNSNTGAMPHRSPRSVLDVSGERERGRDSARDRPPESDIPASHSRRFFPSARLLRARERVHRRTGTARTPTPLGDRSDDDLQPLVDVNRVPYDVFCKTEITASLEELVLKDCALGPSLLAQLVSAFRHIGLHRIALRRLHLGGNDLGDEGVAILAEWIYDTLAMEEAILLDQREGGYEIARKHGFMEWLSVEDNEVTDFGCETLCAALSVPNSCIERLYLDNNRIADRGAIAISTMLMGNQTLEVISLAGNFVGYSGARAIASALDGRHNKTLQFLNLRANGTLSRHELTLLHVSLKDHPSLSRLYISKSALEHPKHQGGDNAAPDMYRKQLQEIQERELITTFPPQWTDGRWHVLWYLDGE